MKNGTTFRRTGILPALLITSLLAVAANLVLRTPALLAATIALGIPVLIFGVTFSLQYVTITDESLTYGLFPILSSTTMKSDLVECRLINFAFGISRVVFNSVLLTDRERRNRGGDWGIAISRYGWGKHSQQLFSTLLRWLEDAPCKINSETTQFIESLGR